MNDSLYSGRIGRLAFARNIALLAVAISIVIVIIPFLQESQSDVAGYALVLLLVGTVYGGFVYSLHSVVRRLHDIGLSGWVALVFYLPPLSIVLLIALLLVRGSPGSNRFGTTSAA